MKTKSTKFQSYEDGKAFFGATRERVLRCIYDATIGGGISRAEIADETDLRLSSVCGSVSELIRTGQVYVSGTEFDPESERTVELLKVRDFLMGE